MRDFEYRLRRARSDLAGLYEQLVEAGQSGIAFNVSDAIDEVDKALLRCVRAVSIASPRTLPDRKDEDA